MFYKHFLFIIPISVKFPSVKQFTKSCMEFCSNNGELTRLTCSLKSELALLLFFEEIKPYLPQLYIYASRFLFQFKHYNLQAYHIIHF